MLNENAKKWVAALRSGEYKQGRNWLLAQDRFCCLGVACNLFDASKWEESREGEKIVGFGHGVMVFDGQNQSLPSCVREWLGLADAEGRHIHGTTLSGLNDTGRSFTDIADLIESEPEGLFKK